MRMTYHEELHTEQIRCKRCESTDCRGCNLFSLSQMLEEGKLNGMMGEDRKIKTDLSVHPVVLCSECEHRLMHKFPYNYEKVLTCNDPHCATIRAVNPMHFCSYGKHKEGEEAKH